MLNFFFRVLKICLKFDSFRFPCLNFLNKFLNFLFVLLINLSNTIFLMIFDRLLGWKLVKHDSFSFQILFQIRILSGNHSNVFFKLHDSIMMNHFNIRDLDCVISLFVSEELTQRIDLFSELKGLYFLLRFLIEHLVLHMESFRLLFKDGYFTLKTLNWVVFVLKHLFVSFKLIFPSLLRSFKSLKLKIKLVFQLSKFWSRIFKFLL